MKGSQARVVLKKCWVIAWEGDLNKLKGGKRIEERKKKDDQLLWRGGDRDLAR